MLVKLKGQIECYILTLVLPTSIGNVSTNSVELIAVSISSLVQL